MKNLIFTIGICMFIFGFSMSACKSKNSNKSETNETKIATGDTSENSLDWNGTYTGTVPCADCAGIFTQITLNADKTYSLKTNYVGKEGVGENLKGTFQWDAAGKIITLSGLKDKSMPSSYQVGENKLIQLDMNGKVITGELASNYVLTKVNENLVEKKWKLFELNGVAISVKNPNPATEAFIMFQVDGNKVNGNSGCNNFAGTYKIDSGNQLHFSGMVSTRKMCIDMSIEDKMNKLFPIVDSYTLQNDTLSLIQAANSLARFKL